ncbi:hypothetical protein NDU88_008671 [Pleurodeles waltl]|uniref:Uncharacterized protein n=1 Tax=Pleurodeles waltl TaxID=8319 RepID=A0AAV7RT22_PLEWA|nr:hypothetical protein NDU88_008671 [Pleurodeles waltl]
MAERLSFGLANLQEAVTETTQSTSFTRAPVGSTDPTPLPVSLFIPSRALTRCRAHLGGNRRSVPVTPLTELAHVALPWRTINALPHTTLQLGFVKLLLRLVLACRVLIPEPNALALRTAFPLLTPLGTFYKKGCC